jgi:lysophospholipase L1-like esterase
MVFAQDTIRFSIPNDLGLVDYEESTIANPQHLDPFFRKLSELKKNKNGTVSIMHIGDSHIQADYLSHQLRQNFQREFGNSGRGFLVPNQVAQTNEAANYNSRSTGKWEPKRMVFTEQPLPTGLGGVTVRSGDEGATIKISLKHYPALNYNFNKITAFFHQEPRSYHVVVMDTLSQNMAYFGNFTSSVIQNSATLNLPYSTNKIIFKSIKNLAQQDRVTYFGFNFENGLPGILYHSLGANGAKYKHYLAAEYFIEQSKALKPDLIIISLGTNEAIDHPYSDPKFPEYIEELIKQLQNQNPDAVFMITTPPDSYRKKNKRNPGVANIREKLLDYVNESKIASYDLYQATGGKHSADDWKKAALLRDDGIHFTRAGYELQGNMLYDALIKAYNNYVSNRRK